MDVQINKLQKILNIKFNNTNLLIQSITHKSYNSEINYEKLEFLRDSVLGLIISNKLLELYPNDKVGILDKKFSNLVNKNICYEIGTKLKLNNFVLVGNSKKKIIDILNPIITSFLKKESIQILFQKDKIIFGDESLDITDEILNIFNKKHKKLKFE